ncbi:Predicted arabinose efflux permease, MFS family [Bosea sp. OK403]|uniref:MFS transporter n=1 Tax=Bosea sp. OK403 TaxID=1855286 RepID=UPI0008E4DBDE|nr:MFS transporter [Bosea sp. OK403]SFH97848.1 Predicted arabinose efflux permease, MFS family [Bosea sp. OK403]
MQDCRATPSNPIWRDPRTVALLMAASLTTMANATISPALPGLERLFSGDPNAAILTRLLVPAPSLSVALCAPLAGLVADRFGRRAMLLSGTILFVIAGCAGLVLPDLPTIFASRLVLGIAVALIMTAQTALVGDYFTGKDRNALTGLQISARNFGGLIFISLAGWAAVLSPRLPFAIYGLAAAFLPLMWIAIVDPPRPTQSLSAKPANGAEGHAPWRVRLALLVFLQALTNLIFFVMPTQLSFFLDERGYNSAAMTGAALGILMLSGGGFALLYSRIQHAIGHIGIFAMGYAAMALGFLLLPLAMTASHSFAATAAIGAGYALVSPGFIALALGLAPLRRRGLAGGLLTASVFIGQFCSPLLSTPLIARYGFDGLFHGAALLLLAMTIAAGAAGVLSWLRLRSALTSQRIPVSPRSSLP